MPLLDDPLRYLARLAFALTLSVLLAVVSYAGGTWMLKQVVSLGLQLVPA